MSAAAVLEWAAAEGVRLEVRQGRIAWQADHQPPADLLARLQQHRQAVIETLEHQYQNAVATAAGVPWDWLMTHYFTADDQAEIERGRRDPVAFGQLIKTDWRYPFGWLAQGAAEHGEKIH